MWFSVPAAHLYCSPLQLGGGRGECSLGRNFSPKHVSDKLTPLGDSIRRVVYLASQDRVLGLVRQDFLSAIPTSLRTPLPPAQRGDAITAGAVPGHFLPAGSVPAACPSRTRLQPAERRCAHLLPGCGAPGQPAWVSPQVPSAAHLTRRPDPVEPRDRVRTPRSFYGPKRAASTGKRPPPPPRPCGPRHS